LLTKYDELQAKNIEIEYTAIGYKRPAIFESLQSKLISQTIQIGDTPHLDVLLGAITAQLEAFEKGEIDAVYLAYTRFVNAMKQEPVLEKLLPLEPTVLSADNKSGPSWDYIYEPDAKSIIEWFVEALC
jgi:F-type H+-transporting ATPase subunit gamma